MVGQYLDVSWECLLLVRCCVTWTFRDSQAGTDVRSWTLVSDIQITLWANYEIAGEKNLNKASQATDSLHAKSLQSCLTLATLWTVVCQAPLSMGFSRQEYWSGLSFPPPGDLPDPGIEPTSPATPASQVDSLLLTHRGSPDWFSKPLNCRVGSPGLGYQ